MVNTNSLRCAIMIRVKLRDISDYCSPGTTWGTLSASLISVRYDMPEAAVESTAFRDSWIHRQQAVALMGSVRQDFGHDFLGTI
jgi:hypothetical protein